MLKRYHKIRLSGNLGRKKGGKFGSDIVASGSDGGRKNSRERANRWDIVSRAKYLFAYMGVRGGGDPCSREGSKSKKNRTNLRCFIVMKINPLDFSLHEQNEFPTRIDLIAELIVAW